MYLPLFVAALLLLAGTVASGSCSNDNGQAGSLSESAKIGKHAPDFLLSGLDGEKVSLADLRGKPVVLNFWATWCGYCVEEMPLLQEAHDERAAEGLVLLAINSGETAAQAGQFMLAYGYSFQVLLDSNQSVTIDYNIRGMPTTFFIDAEGIIKDIKVGAFLSKAQVEAGLNKILP